MDINSHPLLLCVGMNSMKVLSPALHVSTIFEGALLVHGITTYDVDCLEQHHRVVKDFDEIIIFGRAGTILVAPESNQGNWEIDCRKNAPFIGFDATCTSFTVIAWDGVDPRRCTRIFDHILDVPNSLNRADFRITGAGGGWHLKTLQCRIRFLFCEVSDGSPN